MDFNEQNRELVERYLLGQLDPEAKLSFESRMTKDERLRLEVQNQKQFLELVKEEHNKDLKATLQLFESNSVKPGQVKSSMGSRYKWIGLVAAALMIAAIVFWMLAQGSKTQGSQVLFAEHFKAYPNTLVEINRGENSSDEVKALMTSYLEGDYKKAVVGFDHLYQQTDKEAYKFYKAVSLLAEEETALSIPIFQSLLESKEWQEAARWYLGLAYLKSNHPEKTKDIFNIIQQSGQKYQRSASAKILTLLD